MTRRTVELRVPASGEYLVLARTAAAAVAARLDFTLDRLEDLRLAVDEAAGLLLADAPAGADLVLRLTPDADGDGLEVTVFAPSSHGRVPHPGTFAWTVLTALVDEVTARADADGVTLVLHSRSDVAVGA
jgi:serine/threonine-protein kinase RsbW